MSFEKELTFLGASWLKSLGISAKFAVDGIALLMVVLSTFVVFITLFMSKMHIRSKHKLYYSMVFLLESAILGTFCAKDMFHRQLSHHFQGQHEDQIRLLEFH